MAAVSCRVVLQVKSDQSPTKIRRMSLWRWWSGSGRRRRTGLCSGLSTFIFCT
ncbi:hypothetical protein HanRHA438_Chr01g0040381 [Helianthus annuus]|uniref:Uncharacterized protein n=1 Tax=Helianthus annuus TaxID=4232 RepID=A0A251VSW8_HELAN|nr:hypothetical protein HanXRQr2_Chr01g0039521 [Helianthus annuus]KAJ0612874.1 hypothetical protein HanHA300_Chr01g0032181 [Helianthus annuus]KAJ0628262.1 hypothetical protein HanHA89_Chr01g0034741 [Helianthus annuus]KAJ0784548.1 hypothetical protein HanLR1_Chr01g0033231 [Helianthus annuus]KAJ0949596.1 hypothetical protein HanRHA438_Chr01g0040381 [Helianthus annuus]